MAWLASSRIASEEEAKPFKALRHKRLSGLATGDRREPLELKKLTGPQAGSLKYDLLTALSVAGLQGSPTLQTSLMRLCAMVTARYNWRLDEISIGQEELARIWAVNPRTVKREMKRLTSDGWLVCLRPGVRGRVGAYRLNYARIYDQTRAVWPSVGADFADRMEEMSGSRTVVRVDFTKQPLRAVAEVVPEVDGLWGRVLAHLQASHPEICESWFAQLRSDGLRDGELILLAPNRFVEGYIETHLMRYVTEAMAVCVKSTGQSAPHIRIVAEN